MSLTLDHPSIAGRILRSLRQKQGQSQVAIGEQIGLSGSTISRVERGRRAVGEEELRQVLSALKEDYDKFLASLRALVLFEKASAGLNYVIEEKPSRQPSGIKPQTSKTGDLVQVLKAYFAGKPQINEVFLFGSFARGEQHAASDIDLYLIPEKGGQLSLYDLSRVKLELEDITGRSVDLVLQGSEYSFVRNAMEADKILIHGR